MRPPQAALPSAVLRRSGLGWVNCELMMLSNARTQNGTSWM